MTRAESLAMLHRWANLPQSSPATIGNLNHAVVICNQYGLARNARSHGLAAVQAIRVFDHPDGCLDRWHRVAVSESRLAVRAALRAVGLKTL
jgi:hypothetical protein